MAAGATHRVAQDTADEWFDVANSSVGIQDCSSAAVSGSTTGVCGAIDK